jgi:hypothetical protein
MSLSTGYAAFHLWSVSEVYTSPNGSVQYVKFSTASDFENSLANHVLMCVSSQKTTNTYTFPANLPTTSTGGKTFIVGTSNLALVPGGVTPDFLFTDSKPFLFLDGISSNVSIVGTFTAPAIYTNLPTDGESSLTGSGRSWTITPNSPKNLNGESNHIVPVKFLSTTASGGNFVTSFRTATGINASAGPNYSVEFKNQFSDSTWSPLTTVPGDGTTKFVTNSMVSAPQRFFRLNVP